ncbi:SAM-dependent methyltransferase [Pediococcus siamensis]|uniref:SAM-dependent methyltransferase n=1 Tax=Pediococcus siamensis TaxID=381829 RepID=UPI0039A12B50
MNSKKLNQLRKQARKTHKKQPDPESYMEEIRRYDQMFQDFPQITFLTHNILASDRLIAKDLLPQSLPMLEIPDNFQDVLFQTLLKKYPLGDPRGDQLWDTYSTALPRLDKLLRSYRDYLEDHYGMWAYISAPFVKDLAAFLNGAPALEVMAGNGLISAGLKELDQPVFATDSQDWTQENETGKHALTLIEPLDALQAWQKYQHQVKYVIISWSPDKLPIDWQLLQAMRATNPAVRLICIGEKFGSSGSHQFWQHAKYIENEAVKTLNRHFSHFDLIHDQVYLIH